MKFRRTLTIAAAVAGSLALALTTAVSAGAVTPFVAHRASHDEPQAVFVQSNDPAGNVISVYRRMPDGRLRFAGRYATAGRGGSEAGAVIDPLASQGSLTYDAAHRLLFAVNAGSDSVTVFHVHGDRLVRAQTVASGGDFPVSVSVSAGIVYVLNAGGAGSISGFWEFRGRLVPIPDSTRSLNLGASDQPPFLASPAQVAVTPTAHDVIVATKTHGTVEVFPLNWFGHPAAHPVTTHTGPVPFALSFDQHGRLQVADASGGVSTYRVDPSGALAAVSPFVANGQQATCWSVPVGQYLYVANAGSNSISGYREDRSGSLHLLDPSGVSAPTSSGPVDMAASSDGRYLYQLATGAGVIDTYRIGALGSLVKVGEVAAFPADHGSGAEGIAAT